VLIGVELPKGKESGTNKRGTITLGSSMKLRNVLYGPDLRYNLILVGQVSRDLNCFVTFYDDISYCRTALEGP